MGRPIVVFEHKFQSLPLQNVINIGGLRFADVHRIELNGLFSELKFFCNGQL